MYHIHCLNKISPKGTALLTDNYAITDDRNQADGVLVRSADMHNVALPESLLAVARAGAGVNNIPLSDCAEAGVVVFNTPGANANSVMELALCGMLLSSRDVVGGINWVQTIKDDPDIAKLVEKGKSKFAGHEIRHKNLGVIGLGAVGGPLANAARNLGMTVYGCDPFISIEAAWHLDSHIVRVNNRDEIYSKCDIISLHTPLLDDTRGMINAEALAKMKDGVIVLNFARDLLVDDDAMAAALASGKVARYVTDFPNGKTANMPGCIAIPHLGASTEESEDNCAKMAVDEIMNYLETGNIVHSVNLPNVNQPRSTVCRICAIHRNVSGVINKLSSILAEDGINIENMVNASKKDYAYSVFDVAQKVDAGIAGKLSAIPDVIRVRII